jgi:hypothetical protein
MRGVLVAFGIIATSLGAGFLRATWKGLADDLATTLLAGIVLLVTGLWVLATIAFTSR